MEIQEVNRWGTLLEEKLQLDTFPIAMKFCEKREDVPENAVVAGVPARQIGWVCECGKKLGESLACSCGRRYRLEGDTLSPVQE